MPEKHTHTHDPLCSAPFRLKLPRLQHLYTPERIRCRAHRITLSDYSTEKCRSAGYSTIDRGSILLTPCGCCTVILKLSVGVVCTSTPRPLDLQFRVSVGGRVEERAREVLHTECIHKMQSSQMLLTKRLQADRVRLCEAPSHFQVSF